MAVDPSVSALVTNLKAQIAFHRDRQAFHAGHEATHRQQRETHATELESLTRHLEAFEASASAAMELASRPSSRVLPPPAPDPDPGRRPRLSRMVATVVQSWPADEPFGTTGVTTEINRRYRDRLKKPADPRMVSLHLRRLLATGQVTSVREGRPFHEALYVRGG